MQVFKNLLSIASGSPSLRGDENTARRSQAIIAGLLGSVGLAAVWGLAAGSGVLGLALANLYKVPLVVLFSTLAAIPAGLLAYKLLGASYRSSELLLSFVAGVFTGALTLASLSPLVALYYHTSAWAGPALAIGTVVLAIAVAGLVFIRGARRRIEVRGMALGLPVAVLVVMQLAAMVQLIAMASPILPEHTVFDSGVDAVMR